MYWCVLNDWIPQSAVALYIYRVGGLAPQEILLQDLCNTRFIKGHKPSNHIRARIKSHVYITEWTVYHSTYHVKDIIKRIRMLFITLMTKMSDTAEAKYKIRIKLYEAWSRAPQGRRLGDEHLEVLEVLVALDELPHVGRNWAAVA